MTNRKKSCATVAFKRRGAAYQGSVALQDLELLRNDPAETMRVATGIYQRTLAEIRQWQRDAKSLRQLQTPLSAKKAWELGDIVHRLEADLAEHACRLENLYDHLTRHAGTSAWLSQYVTFRRYISNVEAIPDGLKWNSIAKTAKSAGLSIADSLPEEKYR